MIKVFGIRNCDTMKKAMTWLTENGIAYEFIDFLLQPEIGARLVNGTSYASANLAARQFIRPEILADPAIYPPDEVVARCELIEDLGDTTTLLDELWTEIKAQ